MTGTRHNLPTMAVTIRNIVCKVVFSHPFDIIKLYDEHPSVFYKIKSFNSVSCTITPRTFCQLFGNGKAIVNGGQSVDHILFLVHIYESFLKMLGYEGDLVSTEIVNIVATFDYGKPLSLPDLAKQMLIDNEGRNRLFWEPELHSAARFRFENYKTTVHVFHTGKIVALGGKNLESIQQAVNQVIKHIINGDFVRRPTLPDAV